MSDKGKCDWCGLVFDFIVTKPKLRIQDTGDLLCSKCADDYKSNHIETDDELDGFVEYLQEQMDSEYWWFDEWIEDRLKEFKLRGVGKMIRVEEEGMPAKRCPDCNKPMRLEKETILTKVWVCDYCGMRSNISS